MQNPFKHTFYVPVASVVLNLKRDFDQSASPRRTRRRPLVWGTKPWAWCCGLRSAARRRVRSRALHRTRRTFPFEAAQTFFSATKFSSQARDLLGLQTLSSSARKRRPERPTGTCPTSSRSSKSKPKRSLTSMTFSARTTLKLVGSLFYVCL